MAVDTSMYGMIKPVDVMGSVEGGLRMRDMIEQRPMQKQAMSLDLLQKKNKVASQLLNAVGDDGSGWDQVRAAGIQNGIWSDQEVPTIYDPGFVGSMKKMTMDNDEKWKQKGFDLEKEKVDIARQEAGVKKVGEVGKLATDLRKERSDLPTTKDTQKVAASYNRIQKAATDPSAAGDLALIFNYMKMLDPGSTVREGEFANAQNAAGVPDQIRNMYERVRSGQRLNPDQRADFLNKAGGQYQAQLDLQNQADQTFVALAQRSGIDPKDVIVDFQATKPVSKMTREEKIARLKKLHGGKVAANEDQRPEARF